MSDEDEASPIALGAFIGCEVCPHTEQRKSSSRAPWDSFQVAEEGGQQWFDKRH
eukprot:TRINITY_DN2082_c3_g1_i1.p1 TRINITY_DN2082_c3_g1~~TRINITY_DN2082_c3_g1_i1.p1  ORF type:complete len:54 (+),score=7.35 TRINITY_DN2082_c3_g1_i1:211-372(+)